MLSVVDGTVSLVACVIWSAVDGTVSLVACVICTGSVSPDVFEAFFCLLCDLKADWFDWVCGTVQHARLSLVPKINCIFKINFSSF